MTGGDKQCLIFFADHFEGAPEAGFRDFAELAADDEPVAEAGGAAVVDFGPSEDREDLAVGHGFHVHAEVRGEPRATGLDHPQVGEVVDDAAAIRIKEHDFFAGFHDRNLSGHEERLELRLASCNLRVSRCVTSAGNFEYVWTTSPISGNWMAFGREHDFELGRYFCFSDGGAGAFPER